MTNNVQQATRIESFIDWFADRREAFDGLLIDIDGTLTTGQRSVPRAAEFLQWLQTNDVPFFLVTNDCDRSHQQKADWLAERGIDVAPDELVSCGDALAACVDEHGIAGEQVFVLGELGDPCYARQAGLRPVRSFEALPECAAVVIGARNYDMGSTCNAVINFLVANRDALLIVPNPDRYWPAGANRIAIGPGSVARFIAMVVEDYCHTVSPIYLGKPNAAVFNFAIAQLQQRTGLPLAAQPERILTLGDSLKSDIRGANRLGLTSALVLTGITSEAAVHSLPPDDEKVPDLIFAGLCGPVVLPP